MSLLKDCPFCGSSRTRMFTEKDHDGLLWIAIKCGECQAKSGGKWYHPDNDCPMIRQEVRDQWNLRTEAHSHDK